MRRHEENRDLQNLQEHSSRALDRSSSWTNDNKCSRGGAIAYSDAIAFLGEIEAWAMVLQMMLPIRLL